MISHLSQIFDAEKKGKNSSEIKINNTISIKKFMY